MLMRSALLTVALVTAGCDYPAHSVDPEVVRLVVLEASDLPGAFSELSAGPSEGRLDRVPPGRRASWSARYRRTDPETKEGPLIVLSSAEIYADAEATPAALERIAERETPSGGKVKSISLGDEGWTVSYDLPALPQASVFHVVAWRRLNVVAHVVVQGLEGRVALGEAEQLARLQDAKIERAATG